MSGTEAGLSSNFPTVSDAEVLDWMQKAERQKRRAAEEQGAYRAILKGAKNAGINLKAMIATGKAAKLDHDTVRIDTRDQIRYMALRRLPVTPEHLFSGIDLDAMQNSHATNDKWDAEVSGYRAGHAGTVIDDNPHPAGSEFFVIWRDYWNQGQAARARELGPNAEQAPARRGRPPRQERIPGTEPRQATPRKAGAKPPKQPGLVKPAKQGRKGSGRKTGRVVAMPRRRRPADGGDQPSAA
jgi:hypothetical protein